MLHEFAATHLKLCSRRYCVDIRFVFPAFRQSPVGERLGTESGSDCQSDGAAPPIIGRRCADSHMPILLGNYLHFALLGFLLCGHRLSRTTFVVALRLVLLRLGMPDLVVGCCPRSATTYSRGVQIAFHLAVKPYAYGTAGCSNQQTELLKNKPYLVIAALDSIRFHPAVKQITARR